MQNKLLTASLLSLSIMISMFAYYYFTESLQATLAPAPIVAEAPKPPHQYKERKQHLNRITRSQNEPNTDKIITIKQLAKQLNFQNISIQPLNKKLIIRFNKQANLHRLIKRLLYRWPAATLSNLELTKNNIVMTLQFPTIEKTHTSKKHYSHYTFAKKPTELKSTKSTITLAGTMLSHKNKSAIFRIPKHGLIEAKQDHTIRHTHYKLTAIQLHSVLLTNTQTQKTLRLQHA
jgi:hypothetical protein